MARPRQVSDEQMLHTMRSCVIEQGAAVSLDAVAEALGLTGPALLKRFGSRQELVLRALMPPEAPAWVLELERGPDDRPFSRQLGEVLNGISAFCVEMLPALVALRQSGIPPETMAERQPNPTRGTDALAKWLGRARAKGLITATEHDTAAIAIMGAVQGNIMMAHFYKRAWSHRSQRGYLKDLVQLFSRALTARNARSPLRLSSRRKVTS